MSSKTGPNGKVRRSKRRPNYSAEQQATILHFLERRRKGVIESIKTIHEMADGNKTEWDKESLKYWRWAFAVLAWLEATVTLSKRRDNASNQPVSND